MAAQRGEAGAFSALVSMYEGRLFNFLLRRVRDAGLAEDLAQDTFLRAWQRIGRYDSRWKFSTWLFTIGARLAASRARADGRRRAREDRVIAETPAPTGHDPLVELVAAEGRASDGVWALADRILNEDQRAMLWLRYVEDLSMREIATVMGRTEIGVRVALFRSRDTLACAMEREGRASAGGGAGSPARVVEGTRTGGASVSSLVAVGGSR